ncbi:MFS transporter [Kineococcus sp. SYSU DK001]|uniref:MFS transporter n=1 Tax=Kineococcus sp. SYSU DK001 TaxID=3383122 RepID=UPI003D7EB78F
MRPAGIATFVVDGYAPTVRPAGAGGLCVGVLGYLGSPVVAGTLLGIAAAGSSGTLVQSAACADLAEAHGENSARALSEGSAVSQAAGIVAPLAVGAAGTTVLGWRAGLAVVVALTVAVAVAAASRHRGRPAPPGPPATSPPRGRAPFPRRFRGVWGGFVVVLGIEFCMALWAPVVLADRADVPGAWASASPACMLAGILVGRVAVGRLSGEHPVDALLLASIAVSALGFAVFWTAPVAWVAFASPARLGLGVAGQFPLSPARLTAASGGRTDDASAWGARALGIAIAGARSCWASSGTSSGCGPGCCSSRRCAGSRRCWCCSRGPVVPGGAGRDRRPVAPGPPPRGGPRAVELRAGGREPRRPGRGARPGDARAVPGPGPHRCAQPSPGSPVRTWSCGVRTR